MRYIDSKIPVRSVQSFHDRKELALVDDLRGAPGAMLTGAVRKVALTTLITFGISASGFATSGQSIRFDAFIIFETQGAGSGLNQGTEVSDINSEGAIVATYGDNNGIFHGFLRNPNALRRCCHG